MKCKQQQKEQHQQQIIQPNYNYRNDHRLHRRPHYEQQQNTISTESWKQVLHKFFFFLPTWDKIEIVSSINVYSYKK